MESTLLTDYKTRVLPELREKLGYKNLHQVPKIEKVVLNCCVGSQTDRKQAMEDATHDITLITGQKPIVTKSKVAISNFKLRGGEALGVKVTLRGAAMYDFLLRFIRMALPKIRDFRGVSPKSFDGKGNYTIGISDQSIFPEIELEKIKRQLGYDVTICTSANTDDEARTLLKEMGMPFRDIKTATPIA